MDPSIHSHRLMPSLTTLRHKPNLPRNSGGFPVSFYRTLRNVLLDGLHHPWQRLVTWETRFGFPFHDAFSMWCCLIHSLIIPTYSQLLYPDWNVTSLAWHAFPTSASLYQLCVLLHTPQTQTHHCTPVSNFIPIAYDKARTDSDLLSGCFLSSDFQRGTIVCSMK